MRKKFDYDEIVIVTFPIHEYSDEIKNLRGYIAGDAFDEKQKKWFYGVFIFDKEIVYNIGEDELISTGEFYEED